MAVAITIVVMAMIPFAISDVSDGVTNTWYMSESGNGDGKSEESPLKCNDFNNVNDGDTVILLGTITTNIAVKKNLTIIGDDAVVESTFWIGDITKPTVEIMNIEFKNQITISNVGSVEIVNCSFTLEKMGNVNHSSSISIYDQVDTLSVDHCTFDGSSDTSKRWHALQINMGGSSVGTLKFSNNKVDDFVRGLETSNFRNLIVEGNEFNLVTNGNTPIAIQVTVKDNETVTVRNNTATCDSPAASSFFSVREDSSRNDTASPLMINDNSVIGFGVGILYKENNNGEISEVRADANDNYFSTDGETGCQMTVSAENGDDPSEMVSADEFYLDSEMESKNTDKTPPSIEDDDELPFFPGQNQSSGNNNTTTYIAVAAAAAVVAVLSVLVMAMNKGKI